MADIFGCYIDELFSRYVQSEIHYDHCSAFPWSDDEVIRGVVCKGRNILRAGAVIDRFTFELIGDAGNVQSECNIEVKGNVSGGCSAVGNITVANGVSGGCNSGTEVAVGGHLSGGCNNGGDVTVGGSFSGGCNTGGDVICGGDFSGDVNCRELSVAGNVKAERIKGNVVCNSLECDRVEGDVAINKVD